MVDRPDQETDRDLGNARSPRRGGGSHVADWGPEDQPVWLKTWTSSIFNVPYTQECNDGAMMLILHHSAIEGRNRAIDQFDQIHTDTAILARAMALIFIPPSWECRIGALFP